MLKNFKRILKKFKNKKVISKIKKILSYSNYILNDVNILLILMGVDIVNDEITSAIKYSSLVIFILKKFLKKITNAPVN